MRAIRWAMVAVVVAASTSARAHAPTASSTAEARRLYELALKLDTAHDYEGSARALSAGYALDPRPMFQFDLGLAYSRLQRWADARAALELYLQTAPPDSKRRPGATQLLEQVKAHLPPDPPAAVTATPTAPPAAAPPASPETSPAKADPQLATPAAATMTPAVDTPWWRNPVGWTLLGAGVASIIVGGGLFGEYGSLNDDLAKTSSSETSRSNTKQSMSDYKVAGTTTMAVGGALAIAGAAALIAVSRHEPKHVAARIPVATESGITFALGGGW